ncbi:MAG: aspartyl/asparaginyl beta-hydroxylase domain-containing protein [Legionellaceae bacterium]|nr:aspartyl/asparaginyl beta-hydroxylase domain-containing protein [Legionellaceae bacterium]
MDYHYFKDKVNRFYGRYVGYDKRPTFFEIEKNFPMLHQVTTHFSVIKTEFEKAIANTPDLPRYHEIDPGESEISDACPKQWNVFMLYLLGYQTKEAQALCPTTFSLLKDIPGVIQAFFSILEPGKSIPLHDGPYLGYLRYHLGIHVPKNNPPTITVNKQPYTWREGEAVLFDDSWPHQVHNESDEFRAVLIIDILRPMPFLPNLVNRFITQTIARYLYGKKVINRVLQHDSKIKPLMQ